jgi:hypothetical protein
MLRSEQACASSDDGNSALQVKKIQSCGHLNRPCLSAIGEVATSRYE